MAPNFLPTVGRVLSVAIVCAGLVLAGCARTPRKPKPRPWNVSIVKETPASIRADVIGITALDKPVWAAYNINNYWTAGDRMRAEADKLTQVLQTGTPWVISKDDPKWQEWKRRGVTELVIVADLPAAYESGADPRRLFIPLDKKAWKAKGQTLEIVVQESMLRVMTQQR